jgi:5-methylcytosine-specific restriction endonuclease McrA
MDKKQLAALRRGITPKLRKFILGDGNGCHYCGFPATEVDHIVPVSRGGGLALSNLAPACFECNHEKRDQSVEEWAQARPGP